MSDPGRFAAIGWPPIHQAAVAPLAALAAELDRSQWLAPDEIAALQAQQLAALLAHHAAHSPFATRRLARAGIDPKRAIPPDVFARIAPLGQGALAGAEHRDSPPPESHGEVRAIERRGPRGETLRVCRTALNRLDDQGFALREHGWHGGRGGRLCTIEPRDDAAEAFPDWGPPIALLHRTGPALALPAATPPAELAELIACFAPDTLSTTPARIARLAGWYEENRRAAPRIGDIRARGGPIDEDTLDAARRVFGAVVSHALILPELGMMALQCPENGLHHLMAEAVLIEILDEGGEPCPFGKPGRLVATALRNFATPLIRYDTGLTAVAGAPCGCGRGLPVIERIGTAR